MPDELRAALEESLPADEATRPIPDADEAFYGVGIGAIQELYVEAYHPREIAMAGLSGLRGQLQPVQPMVRPWLTGRGVKRLSRTRRRLLS